MRYNCQSGDEYGDPCYEVLKGPDGFECWITEPEDRTFDRDLSPVVQRLETLEQTINEQRALINNLEKTEVIYHEKIHDLETTVEKQRAAIDGYKGQLRLQDGEIEEQKAEIARLTKARNEFRALNEHHKEQFLLVNLSNAQLQSNLDKLMGEAVKFAQAAKSDVITEGTATQAQAFLDTKEVQAYLKRQEDQSST